MLIARAAEGRERPLTVFTAYDMVFMWPQTHLGASTTAFYSQRIGLRQKQKSESETPCSASGKTFLKKPLDKQSEVCYAYAPEEERAAGNAPDVLDIPTSAPHVRRR